MKRNKQAKQIKELVPESPMHDMKICVYLAFVSVFLILCQ